MDSHMGFQAAIEIKCWTTNVTFVWFLARVDSHMGFQVTGLIKCWTTNITFVWFLACVDSHMGFQVTGLIKCWTTNITFVWFLTCVDSHMGFQVTGLIKCWTTNITPVTSFGSRNCFQSARFCAAISSIFGGRSYISFSNCGGPRIFIATNIFQIKCPSFENTSAGNRFLGVVSIGLRAISCFWKVDYYYYYY